MRRPRVQDPLLWSSCCSVSVFEEIVWRNNFVIYISYLHIAKYAFCFSSLITFAQYLQRCSYDGLSKLVKDVVDLAQKCAANEDAPECSKSLVGSESFGTVFHLILCSYQSHPHPGTYTLSFWVFLLSSANANQIFVLKQRTCYEVLSFRSATIINGAILWSPKSRFQYMKFCTVHKYMLFVCWLQNVMLRITATKA